MASCCKVSDKMLIDYKHNCSVWTNLWSPAIADLSTAKQILLSFKASL